jgi:hypothetical protein
MDEIKLPHHVMDRLAPMEGQVRVDTDSRGSGGQPAESMTPFNRRKFGGFRKGPYGRRSRS